MTQHQRAERSGTKGDLSLVMLRHCNEHLRRYWAQLQHVADFAWRGDG